MADVSQTLKKLQTHAQQIHALAERTITQELDQRVNVDTGRLKKSRFITRRPSASSITSTITYPTMVADYTDKGTRGHGPKHAQFLRFRPKGGGRVIYTKYVKGIKAYRWFSRTMTLPNWRSKLQSALR